LLWSLVIVMYETYMVCDMVTLVTEISMK